MPNRDTLGVCIAFSVLLRKALREFLSEGGSLRSISRHLAEMQQKPLRGTTDLDKLDKKGFPPG